jgi:hypothetical protein
MATSPHRCRLDGTARSYETLRVEQEENADTGSGGGAEDRINKGQDGRTSCCHPFRSRSKPITLSQGRWCWQSIVTQSACDYSIELLSAEIHHNGACASERIESLLRARGDPGLASEERPLFKKDVPNTTISLSDQPLGYRILLATRRRRGGVDLEPGSSCHRQNVLRRSLFYPSAEVPKNARQEIGLVQCTDK